MPSTPARAECVSCHKVQNVYAKHGYCRTCAATSLDVPDSDSPNFLDETGWFKDENGIMRHRDAFGRAS